MGAYARDFVDIKSAKRQDSGLHFMQLNVHRVNV